MHLVFFTFFLYRPDNYELYLKDIFRQRLEVELGQSNPLASKTFFQLSIRQRVEVVQQLCDFRLDAEDVFDLLKVKSVTIFFELRLKVLRIFLNF